MDDQTPDIPPAIRQELAAAAVQHLADRHGVPLLHIKGSPGAEPVWRGRTSSDIDVLIAPASVRSFSRVLEQVGFVADDHFITGSPFGHSRSFTHPLWGPIDVHRFIPGPGRTPEAAFATWWRESLPKTLGGRPGRFLNVPAQRLVTLLHAARSGLSLRADLDVEFAWRRIDPGAKEMVLSLADELDARLPLALATGEDATAWRDRRDYDLWMSVSRGSTRPAEWRARIRAEPHPGRRVGLLVMAGLPNVDGLQLRLGRRPTAGEIVREGALRAQRAVAEQRYRGHGPD